MVTAFVVNFGVFSDMTTIREALSGAGILVVRVPARYIYISCAIESGLDL